MLRLATKKDESSCILLSKTSWPTWWERNEAAGKKHMRKGITDKNCLVALDKKQVIGFVIWSTLWTKLHIDDIYVKENYRKQHVGTDLINKVAILAKKRGFKEIMSDCGRPNKISFSFHTKNGFQETGRIKRDWDNEDSIIFSRKL